MKALVLGGSYFIGRTIVDRLRLDGVTVALLNRGSRPVEGVEQLVADRNDPAAMAAALEGRAFDWVVDTSCYTADQAATAVRALDGRFGTWLYLSTAAVYPGGTEAPFGEGDVGPGREWEEYGWNKLKAEHELQASLTGSGQGLVILRAPYVYGPLNTLPREKWLWGRLLQGLPLWMPGRGTTRLHFVHVSDLADAAVRALRGVASSVEIFNVAQQETPSIREYLVTLADVVGIAPRLVEVDYRALNLTPRDFFPFRDFPCLLDTTRIEAILGWRAHYDMVAGLRQTLESLERTRLLNADVSAAGEQRLSAVYGTT